MPIFLCKNHFQDDQVDFWPHIFILKTENIALTHVVLQNVKNMHGRNFGPQPVKLKGWT